MAVILIRDGILFSFLGFLASQISWKSMPFWKVQKRTWVFFGLLGLVILLHWPAKGTMEILQHYFRNALLPALTFPLALLFFQTRKIEFRLDRIFLILGFITLSLSWLELIWFRNLMWQTRPTGVFGDPLINSGFLLFFSLSLIFSKMHPLFKFLSLLVTVWILFAASSVSAFLGFTLSITATFWLFWSRQRPLVIEVLKKQKRILLAFLGLLIVTAVSIPWIEAKFQITTGFVEKAESLWTSVFCEENCGAIHTSVSERIASNRMAFDLCRSSISRCLIGDTQSAKY
ncbi:MAG: hypothetical protein ACAH59_02895, partial [Pseudobdellovibrionaceae bacterium]